jgi:hypothetical protein
MFRLATLLFVVAFLLFFPTTAAAQDNFVVFGGYSYSRPPVTVAESCNMCALSLEVTNKRNLNGWEFAGSYRFLPFLGVTADFSGHYGDSVSGSSSNVHQQDYLFGPEVSLPRRVSPFAHVLFGQSHQSVSAAPVPGSGGAFSIMPQSTSGFAAAVGGGIDLKIIPHIWLRPIQIDYLATRFHGGTQNQPRVSAGLALHF